MRINQEGKAALLPAETYRGMRTYDFTEQMIETYGDKISVLCIGPAGENQMLTASIQSSDTDNRPCRAAGRGGLGAVMGAMGLKAIVVDQGGKTTHLGCSQCIVHCSNEYVDTDGKYMTASLEYETI